MSNKERDTHIHTERERERDTVREGERGQTMDTGGKRERQTELHTEREI